MPLRNLQTRVTLDGAALYADRENIGNDSIKKWPKRGEIPLRDANQSIIRIKSGRTVSSIIVDKPSSTRSLVLKTILIMIILKAFNQTFIVNRSLPLWTSKDSKMARWLMQAPNANSEHQLNLV